ncbi:MAG: type III secretion system export apparatus subunit SctR [Sorangiineae bacterium]|nr:type III secretion system export apparatus subunit SctR [Polyangiaceae bacterium]MEB2321817.1 type III secretion system export apparatus subunit SctR [Sorangiineae bacterium]
MAEPSSRGCRSGAESRGKSARLACSLGALALTALSAAGAAAAPAATPAATPNPDDLLTRPVALVVALALVGILPFAFMTLTSFVKISTVLQIVRGAIGAQNVPSNTVVMALAGALTLIAMAPVGSRIADRAAPLLEGKHETSELVSGIIEATREPIRAFLRANASARERGRFYEIARAARPEAERSRVGRDDLVVVIPAFVVSELIEAFALGFAIYLPFLIVDLVVSNVLLALGMQMMNPTQVSLPFKLLLFVAVDGWGLLAQALVTGYKPG